MLRLSQFGLGGLHYVIMQAIAAHPGSQTPTFVSAPEPRPPGSGELLCRTIELGVCGTDREILLSTEPVVPPGEPHLILGHECLARVEAIGPGVTKFKPGDLAVPVVRRAHAGKTIRPDMLAFGEFTERGIYHEHGFSLPRWIDRPEYLFAVAPNVAEVAVLAEPISVSEKAMHEAFIVQQARLGDSTWVDPPPRVLVTGMGPIGFAALVGCQARGWPATMWGRDEAGTFRAQLAEAWGAQYTSDKSGTLLAADIERDGFDLILECTGSDEVMMYSAQSLRARGVMVWLGSARRPHPRMHNVEALMRNGLLRNHIHIGTVNSAPRDFESALSHLATLLATHRRELLALITHRVPPADALWHYEQRVPQGIKTVVMFE